MLPLRTPFFYGWVMVAVAGLGIFFSGPGQTYGVSVFVDSFIEHFGWSRSLVPSLYSAGTLAAGLLIGMAGPLVDRHGHRSMLALVSVLFGGALLLMSAVLNPAMLFAGFLLIRLLGQGAIGLVSSTLVPQWFIARRGFAVSLAGLGAAVSAAAVPLLSTYLIGSWGWRGAWLFWAASLALVMAPIAWYLVRGRPEEVGLQPDGLPPSPRVAAAADEGDWTSAQALRRRAFWFMLFCSSVPSMIVTGLTFHHVSMLAERGISAELAATVFTVSALVQIPAGLAAGWTMDRVPGHIVMSALMACQILVMVWLMYTAGPAMAMGYGVLRGVFGAFQMISGGVLWANYFGRRSLATIRGMTVIANVVGSAWGRCPSASPMTSLAATRKSCCS